MKRQDLQKALKALRQEGVEVRCKLNATNEVMQAEYDRLTRKPKRAKKPSGVVLYRGISAIDNLTPIVVIATGLSKSTANPKTGDMIQTWILVENTYPMDAINDGTDVAICGTCPHRKDTETGKRTCYVNPMSFGSVYRAYHRGNYPEYHYMKHGHLFKGRKIRFGSYGDPVNIPTDVMSHLVDITEGHTGYTHQWRNAKFSEYKKWFMASVDSLTEFLQAKDEGWSTFRVHNVNSEITDISCQGGIKTNCALCSLCDGAGTEQRHVGIHAHGGNAKHVVG